MNRLHKLRIKKALQKYAKTERFKVTNAKAVLAWGLWTLFSSKYSNHDCR